MAADASEPIERWTAKRCVARGRDYPEGGRPPWPKRPGRRGCSNNSYRRSILHSAACDTTDLARYTGMVAGPFVTTFSWVMITCPDRGLDSLRFCICA